VEVVGIAEVKGLDPGEAGFAWVSDDKLLAGGTNRLPGPVVLMVVKEMWPGQ
jgi:hypothetical protein